jgi:hypothetical protein
MTYRLELIEEERAAIRTARIAALSQPENESIVIPNET